MHQAFGSDYIAAKHIADALMPKAHSEQRNVTADTGSLALGVFFFVSAFVFLAYGLKFISKIEELGI